MTAHALNGDSNGLNGVAIVGMSGRFPGAADTEQFWSNIRDGVESIRRLSDEELTVSGIDGEARSRLGFVPVAASVGDAALFDAPFFGMSPREAELLDPQQRVFLECCVEALENAAHAPSSNSGLVGVFAGSGVNTYLLNNLLPRFGIGDIDVFHRLVVNNEKDFLAPRVAYKLGLRGPAVTVSSACSTSLVAVHLACQSLLSHECDMTIAGAVTIFEPQHRGYLYQEGSIFSPDGHCRAFDRSAAGTVPGNGAGVVVLMRLADARAGGYPVRAVILGTAVNNDGSDKVGFLAPSVSAQAAVITAAQAFAGITPEDIDYVEAHGTGTHLGDRIEFAALCEAFRARTNRRGFCALGAVKPNIGHLDTASGVAGLIKTVLAMEHGTLPPLLHFRDNPNLDFEDSPFYADSQARAWQTTSRPRCAAVSSFGLGGTNAHVIVEGVDPRVLGGPSRTTQLLLLSAQTNEALQRMSSDLADHLEANPQLALSDTAYTLHVGRNTRLHRHAIVADDGREAVAALRSVSTSRGTAGDGHGEENRPRVALLIGGEADALLAASREFYEHEVAFRMTVDECALALPVGRAFDLTAAYTGRAPVSPEHATCVAFVGGLAMARLLRKWGVAPEVFVGVGAGELVAAHLAGQLSLEGALAQAAGGANGRSTSEPFASKTATETLSALSVALTSLADHPHAVIVPLGWSENSLEEALVPAVAARLVLAPPECRGRSALRALLVQAARLWQFGAELSANGLYAGQTRQRVVLPTYPFERRRYYLERPSIASRSEVPERVGSDTDGLRPGRHPRPNISTVFAEPSSELQRTIAAAWEGLLGISPIGADDDFFELGGDSLMAAELVAQLRRTFRIELPLHALFAERPTIATVARLIEARMIAALEEMPERDMPASSQSGA